MYYKFDVEKTAKEVIDWIRKWFDENGKDCNAVIGCSGGKDSSVVAALCVKALGKERVIGVLMPQGVQSDISDAEKLVKFLDIDNYTINIGDICRSIKHRVRIALNDHWSMQSSINLPPRIRMATLYAIAQTVNGRVSNNCNLSEDWIGYSTRYGDSVGDFSPLSQLTTDEIVAIGDYIGLPYELVHKVPSDGLCGVTDEESFGFSYAVLNKYIRTGVCEDENIKAKIDKMHQKNMFKLLPMPCYQSNLPIIVTYPFIIREEG